MGERRKARLVFSYDQSRGAQGMPHLALLYPCVTLSRFIDPLAVSLELGGGQPADLADARAHIGRKVHKLVEGLLRDYGAADGAVDQRWYWATPALLDARNAHVREWIESKDGLRGLMNQDNRAEADDEAESATGFEKHVDELLDVLDGRSRLGRPPEDLADVIADFALASPAVCAVRAIKRVSRVADPADANVMSAAAKVAAGFRVLFNVPETMGLLRAHDDDERLPYWRRVLSYCVDGNLQAVLDEYAHYLVEGTGMIARPGVDVAREVADQIHAALSPRSSSLTVDEITARSGRVEITPFRLRCRFALRFGDLKDDKASALTRAETVREAFNSPFRPFVLASTSIGQEGLDFHPYCHAAYHWNLPSNPVDLEQREGRVHRGLPPGLRPGPPGRPACVPVHCG